MSLKNGICAIVHFTVIFQIIQNTRKIFLVLQEIKKMSSELSLHLQIVEETLARCLVTNLKYLVG